MAQQQSISWTDDRPEALPSVEVLTAERELELLDRVSGLERQLEELRSESLLDPASAHTQQESVTALMTSLTWKAGRVVTLPVRVFNAVKRIVLR